MSLQELREGVCQIIEAVTEIRVTKELLNLDLDMAGINSIIFVQIIVSIEEKYCVELDDSLLDYAQYKNLMFFIERIVTKLVEIA